MHRNTARAFSFVIAVGAVTLALLFDGVASSGVCLPTNNSTFQNGTATTDNTRPFVQGIIGEEAHAYLDYTEANILDAVVAPNPIINIFGPYAYNSEFQRFRWFFTDSVLGEVETDCEVMVRYHQQNTSAGAKTVFMENFSMLANRSRCWKRNPFRPSQLTMGNIVPAMKKPLSDLYGPIDAEWGCDWPPHAYYLATRGDGALTEVRLVPAEGFTDFDVEAWLVANAPNTPGIAELSHRVQVYFPGFVFGLPQAEVYIIDTRFHRRGVKNFEVQLLTPEFLAILTGNAGRKRSVIPAEYLPYVVNAAADLVAAPAAYKARFPQYADGIDWVVAASNSLITVA